MASQQNQPPAPARDAPSARALPAPVASTWPPLSERNASKRAAVREARAAADAASARVAAAIAAGDKAEESAAKRALSAANASLARAKKALEQELARRERLRVAGLLDASTGDALPGPLATELPFDAMREILWRLPRKDAQNAVPLVCSEWARLPLDVRACCESAAFGHPGSKGVPDLPRIPPASPDAAALHVQLAADDKLARPTMTREALSAFLRSATRLEALTVMLKLDQLAMLAECLAARGPSASSSSLRRLRMHLVCPPPTTGGASKAAAAAAAAVTDAGMEAAGAALASNAPALEFFDLMASTPWTHAAGYAPVQKFVLSLLSHSAAAAGGAVVAAAAAVGGGGGGGGGGARLRELRSPANILTSAVIDRLDESLSIRKLSFLRTKAQVGVYVPRFPPLGGVSETLRAVRFEATAFCPCCGPSPLSVPGARGPFEAYCDVEGVSPSEALAPLAGSVTRLEFVLLGDGAALPQALRLPGCFRKLRGLRSLMVYFAWSTGVPMETDEQAAVPERAAKRAERSGEGADVVLAAARRPPSLGRQQSPPQPWDLLSQLEELEFRFPTGMYAPFGNYELLIPRAGMPNLRRLDMRGTMAEMAAIPGLLSGLMGGAAVPESLLQRFGFGSGSGSGGASRRPPYLPPPPALVPNLRWLGIGFYRRDAKPAPVRSESFISRALDLSALVPPAGGGGSSAQQPSYRHLRSLLIDEADLVVEGGGRKDDEVERVIAAFPAVFPSMMMIHIHRCNVDVAAERVLAGLADAYAAANQRARGGAADADADAADAAASSSDDDDDRRCFLGVCRDCPAYDDSSIPF